MIDFDTQQKITRDVVHGTSTTDSDVDYDNDENVASRARTQAWLNSLPSGSVVDVPSEGVEATQEDVDVMKAWAAGKRETLTAEREAMEALEFLEE